MAHNANERTAALMYRKSHVPSSYISSSLNDRPDSMPQQGWPLLIFFESQCVSRRNNMSSCPLIASGATVNESDRKSHVVASHRHCQQSLTQFTHVCSPAAAASHNTKSRAGSGRASRYGFSKQTCHGRVSILRGNACHDKHAQLLKFRDDMSPMQLQPQQVSGTPEKHIASCVSIGRA